MSVPPASLGGRYRHRSEAEVGVGGSENNPLPSWVWLPHSGRMAKLGKTRTAAARARRLRKDMTPSEVSLWKELRGGRLGYRFRRQEPIGPFIVDFVCRPKSLVIEADGDHHEFSEHDRRRDAYLRSEGYRVMRFWNEDIARYPEWVVEEIRRALAEAGD